LIIQKSDGQLRIAGKYLSPPLAKRPFAVLLVLAEAVLNGAREIPAATIKARLMAPAASDRAVSDAVRDLRERLKPLGMSHIIQTPNNAGYYLALGREDVDITP
jgi:hypothetical protein